MRTRAHRIERGYRASLDVTPENRWHQRLPEDVRKHMLQFLEPDSAFHVIGLANMPFGFMLNEEIQGTDPIAIGDLTIYADGTVRCYVRLLLKLPEHDANDAPVTRTVDVSARAEAFVREQMVPQILQTPIPSVLGVPFRVPSEFTVDGTTFHLFAKVPRRSPSPHFPPKQTRQEHGQSYFTQVNLTIHLSKVSGAIQYGRGGSLVGGPGARKA